MIGLWLVRPSVMKLSSAEARSISAMMSNVNTSTLKAEPILWRPD